MNTSIKGFTAKYSFLSNFWPCKVVLDGIEYTSVEHAYQAAKTNDPEERGKIRLLKSPSEAKKTGRAVKIRDDWDDVKLPIMRDLVFQKFKKGTELGQKLDDTGDAYLEETNWWNDVYWGVCNGQGSNHLGTILMEARDLLRNV